MPILTRYVLSEMLKVFLIALAGMTLFFLLDRPGERSLSRRTGH